MVDFKFLKPELSFLSVLTCIFAVILQIQVTLFSSQEYTGLRINLADCILPFVGIGVLFSLLSRKTVWPDWSFKKPYLWLAGLGIVMSIALIQGYVTNGFISNWALVNKYIGFFILLCYLALGGWLATNNPKLPDLFIRYFCAFYILVLLLSAIAVVLTPFIPFSLWVGNYAWDGFMANRNAFMIPCLLVMIVIETYRQKQNNSFPPWIMNLFWFLIPFFAFFNSSRAGWILGGIIILAFFIKRPKESMRCILPFLLLGCFVSFFYLSHFDLTHIKPMQQVTNLAYLVENQDVKSRGDRKRIIDLKDGVALYQSSNPVLGAGLGSYHEYQLHRDDPFEYLLDSTPLWLLVETGLLGLIAFSAFFILCLWVFYKRGFGEDPSMFHRSLFFFLIAFACISLLHEITYTRFLWFALGFALVQPKTAKI